MRGVNEILDRGTVIGIRRCKRIHDAAVAAEDEVASELEGVLGRPLESPALAQEPRVRPPHLRSPDLPHRPSTESVGAVGGSLLVDEQGERREPVALILGDVLGRAERDDDHFRITELVEAVAHGDRVFLAGQSGEVAVEDQHDWPSFMIGQPPAAAVVCG